MTANMGAAEALATLIARVQQSEPTIDTRSSAAIEADDDLQHQAELRESERRDPTDAEVEFFARRRAAAGYGRWSS